MSTFCLSLREEQAIANMFISAIWGLPFSWKHLKDEIGGNILAHISLITLDSAALPMTSSGQGRSEQLGQDTDPGGLCLLWVWVVRLYLASF